MPPEIEIHSFIIKIWVEHSQPHNQSRSKPAQLHGYITHVPTGDRHYIQRIEDLLPFLRDRLQLPRPPRPWNALHRWLRRIAPRRRRNPDDKDTCLDA